MELLVLVDNLGYWIHYASNSCSCIVILFFIGMIYITKNTSKLLKIVVCSYSNSKLIYFLSKMIL